jgi:hypothetical protein
MKGIKMQSRNSKSGTSKSDTAVISGVVTRARIFDVVPGSFEVNENGNERFLMTNGQILELRDSAVRGYILQEPNWSELKMDGGN